MLEVAGTYWHDALLLSIEVDWRQASARLLFETCETNPRRLALRVDGLRLVHCPRLEPWGSGGALSVLAVRRRTSDGGVIRLELEMQSGDQIEVEGSATSLDVQQA